MRRALTLFVAATATTLLAVPALAHPAKAPHRHPGGDERPATIAPPCMDKGDVAVRFSIPVGREQATGFYTLPDKPPVGIVTFSHGYGHSSYSWQEHMKRVTRELGVISVGMDGRGLRQVGEKSPGIPDTRGWPVVTGAEDGLVATKWFQSACPSAATIVNYGVSMGGNTSGIMQTFPAKRADGRTALFDYWIDVEGVSDLAFLYSVARAAGPGSATAKNAAVDIEEAMGGSLERFPDRYHAASPGQRTLDISRSGVKGVITVQGLDDGLVTPNHEAQLRAGLLAAGVPVQSFTVLSKDAASEQDTSITGTALTNLDKTYRSPMAGHGSERSTVHLVIKTGFDRLAALFRGQPPACTRAFAVDGTLGIVAPAPTPC